MKKHVSPSILLFLLSISFSTAQVNYNLAWSNEELSNIQSYTHTATSIKLNSNNEAIVASTLIDGNQHDLLISKYSESGVLIWKKIIDVKNNSRDAFKGLMIDKNDNIILLGTTKWPENIYKLYLLKLTSNGEKIFETNHNTDDQILYRPSETIFDEDGNIYITGYTDINNPDYTDTPITRRKFFIIKFNQNGAFQWEDKIQTTNSMGYTLRIINNILSVVGSIAPQYSKSILFYRTYTKNGILINNHEKETELRPRFVYLDKDGNSYSNHGRGFGITKYNNIGIKQWEFKVPINLPDNVSTTTLKNVISDRFGNIYLSGTHHGKFYNDPTKYTNGDLYVAKISPKGKIIYTYTYNNQGKNTYERGNRMFLGKNNYLFIGGQSQDDFGDRHNYLAIVLNDFGKPIHIINEKTIGESVIGSVAADTDLNFYVTGVSNNNIVTKKYAFKGSLITDFRIFPNPFKEELLISLPGISSHTDFKLFDITGKQLFHKTYENTRSILVDTRLLKNGFYFYQISSSDGNIQSGKIIKIDTK